MVLYMFNSFKYLCAVIEKGSFVAAAKYLGVSKAAVSQQIRSLEKDIGLQLLKRTSRQVDVTEVGLLYYEQIKRAMSELKKAEDLVAMIKKQPQGKLHVATIRYFMHKDIIPHVAQFKEAFPSIDLNLSILEKIPDLEKENIDMFYGLTMWQGSVHVKRRKFMETHYTLCGSPEYFRKFGTPTALSHLTNHNYIDHTARNLDKKVIFDNDNSVPINTIFKVNDISSLIECALQGFGLIKTHHYEVDAYIQKGLLKPVLQRYTKDIQPVYIYYLNQDYLQPKIRVFIDFILEKNKDNHNFN